MKRPHRLSHEPCRIGNALYACPTFYDGSVVCMRRLIRCYASVFHQRTENKNPPIKVPNEYPSTPTRTPGVI